MYYSAIWCSTVYYSIVQYNTIQYNTIPPWSFLPPSLPRPPPPPTLPHHLPHHPEIHLLLNTGNTYIHITYYSEYSITVYNTALQRNTALQCTIQYYSVQYSITVYNTLLQCTIQYNSLQYSIIVYIMILQYNTYLYSVLVPECQSLSQPRPKFLVCKHYVLKVNIIFTTSNCLQCKQLLVYNVNNYL